MKKSLRNRLVIFLIAVMAFCFVPLVNAETIEEFEGTTIVVEKGGMLNLFGAQEEKELGAYIASPTGFTDVNITNDLVVDGIMTVDDYLYFNEGTSVGLRWNGTTMQYNNGSSWSEIGGGTPGDEGWFADANDRLMYTANNIDGEPYRICLNCTATTTPSDSTTYLQSPGGIVLTGTNGTLDVAGAVSFDGGAFIFNDSGAALDFTIEGDTDTALLVADGSGDKVGISISVPTYTLDVGGDIGMDDKLYHNDDADSYLTWDAADNFSLLTGNVEFLNFTEDAQDVAEFGDGTDIDFIFNDMMHIAGDSGFVGIGDDTTADTMLEVVDATGPQVTIAHTDTVDYMTINIDSDGDADIILSGGDYDWGNENHTTTGNLTVGAITASGNITFDTSTLIVDATGNNVGVGTTTPGWKLSVTDTSSQLSLAYDTNGYALFDVDASDDLTITASGGEIDFGDENVSTTGTFGAAATTLSSTLAVTGVSTLTDDLVVDTDTLFVDNSADMVGIGTSTPATVLEVHAGTGSSTISVLSETDSVGGSIILEDTDGAGCSEISVLNGVISIASVTCPAN